MNKSTKVDHKVSLLARNVNVRCKPHQINYYVSITEFTKISENMPETYEFFGLYYIHLSYLYLKLINYINRTIYLWKYIY